MIRPDYQGGSIVNLMSSVLEATGGAPSLYPPLRDLDDRLLAGARNIVLFVVDALGYDYLVRRGDGGVLKEHLQARLTSVFPPTTATAVTAFLTATAPQQHGLTGWFTYFRELDTVVTVLPFTARCGGESLAGRGISAASLYGHVPVFDRMDVAAHLVSPAWIAHSDFSLAHRGRAQISPYSDLSQCFETIAALVRGARQRQYIHAYWPGLDTLGHERGMESAAAAEHFAEIDRGFARLLESVQGTDTRILVTADHGMLDAGHADEIDLADHPGLAQTLDLPLCGEKRLAYCYVRPERRASFEDYVRSELAGLVRPLRSAELIDDGYYGLGEPHPRLHERVGDFALAATGRHTINDQVPGERRIFHVGAHGGVSATEMYVPLVVMRA